MILLPFLSEIKIPSNYLDNKYIYTYVYKKFLECINTCLLILKNNHQDTNIIQNLDLLQLHVFILTKFTISDNDKQKIIFKTTYKYNINTWIEYLKNNFIEKISEEDQTKLKTLYDRLTFKFQNLHTRYKDTHKNIDYENLENNTKILFKNINKNNSFTDLFKVGNNFKDIYGIKMIDMINLSYMISDNIKNINNQHEEYYNPMRVSFYYLSIFKSNNYGIVWSLLPESPKENNSFKIISLCDKNANKTNENGNVSSLEQNKKANEKIYIKQNDNIPQRYIFYTSLKQFLVDAKGNLEFLKYKLNEKQKIVIDFGNDTNQIQNNFTLDFYNNLDIGYKTIFQYNSSFIDDNIKKQITITSYNTKQNKLSHSCFLLRYKINEDNYVFTWLTWGDITYDITQYPPKLIVENKISESKVISQEEIKQNYNNLEQIFDHLKKLLEKNKDNNSLKNSIIENQLQENEYIFIIVNGIITFNKIMEKKERESSYECVLEKQSWGEEDLAKEYDVGSSNESKLYAYYNKNHDLTFPIKAISKQIFKQEKQIVIKTQICKKDNSEEYELKGCIEGGTWNELSLDIYIYIYNHIIGDPCKTLEKLFGDEKPNKTTIIVITKL